MSIEIEKVSTARQLKEFILLPFKIYQNDSNFVPPLISEKKKFLDRSQNPFFLHSRADYFLAQTSQGEVVGRIAAIYNAHHIKVHKEKIGFFGFFESINDLTVARKLFDTASSWLKRQNVEIMRGPTNFTTNDEIGLLVDGFNRPPVVMMTYNPRYYIDLIEHYGFKKVKDIYAYYYESRDGHIPERLKRASAMLEKKNKFSIRSLNMKKFDQEIKAIRQIYNNAWELNWGFIPMTEEEFHHLAKDLKQIVDADLCLLAEVEGKLAGFCLTLPDINQALIKINGRLFPLGLFKLLYYLKKMDMVRVITMGVIKEYRLLGIDTCFYYQTFARGLKKGYWRGEFSWVLEDNAPMNLALEKMGATIYKTYRLYDYYL